MSSTGISGPIVVKAGGSLIDCIGRILVELRDSGVPALIVPGGGPFARLVRSLKAREEEAHWMAVAAMEQYGWYIASFGIPVTESLEVPHETKVLLTYRLLRERDPLPHAWSVTSDSIAAWVAGELGLELIVLKSVDGIRKKGELLRELQEPVSAEEVDPLFMPSLFERGVKATILNARVPGRLRGLLSGVNVPCTRIHPRF